MFRQRLDTCLGRDWTHNLAEVAYIFKRRLDTYLGRG
jgi:hypothetical protein